MDQTPSNPNPAPVDQTPVDQTPVDQTPVAAPAGPVPASASGGFFVRAVDAAGRQVGEIVTAETGSPRAVVRGLENGSAYRVQVAPATKGEPKFSELSKPVVPGKAA
ncbi:hypothetical protein ABQG64_06615, partial [Escherichia coli]